MSTNGVNAPVLHNVKVYTGGLKAPLKPQTKVIETLDFSKVKYAPQAATEVVEETTKKPGFFAKMGDKLKAVGTKLTKTKAGKYGLIAAAVGAVLVGTALLLKKCSGDDDKVATTPGATDPTTPGATDPTTPGATDPTTPGATDPNAPGSDDPDNSNPGATDPNKPNLPPALPGENVDGAWASADGNEMLCRDASGLTKDIKGKLKIISETEKNPDEFSITDKSSGEAHEYKYKKIGVNDKGQPIYKCVSMNDYEIVSENQYTLEWADDKTPKLIQHKNQDNYGIGLKKGKKIETAKEADAPKEKETPVEANKDEVKVYNEIWINRQPGPGRQTQTLDEFKAEVTNKCEHVQALTDEQKKKLNECKNEEQVIKYLETIGIKISFAY